MKIEEWFDAHNLEHIKAYKMLMDTGQWPKDFIPAGTLFAENWYENLMKKMADAWVRSALASCKSTHIVK